MAVSPTLVVVGASLAGLRAAEAARQRGFSGRLVLVGAERHLPYDRPPLSKALLAGTVEPDRILLRKPDQLDALGLDLRLGVRATAFDTAARTIDLRDQHGDTERLSFDAAVIATGARPRRLPGQEHAPAGVHELRTFDDGAALRRELAGDPPPSPPELPASESPGSPSKPPASPESESHAESESPAPHPRRLVVIGGGFIGAEVAATARGLGHHVTILEALPAPMVRGIGAEMGAALGAVHTANGVDLRCGVGVAGFVGDERVTGVLLDDATVVAADVVLVGVGVVPDTAWLDGSGLTIDNGVVTDAHLRAAPGVFAAGDVARFPFGGDGSPLVRLEHWTNANEQGGRAGDNAAAELAGEPTQPFTTVPFVWSDQYDKRIQVVGRISGDHRMTVVSGSIAEGSWVAIYGDGDRFSGALAVNQPRRLAGYRKLLLQGQPTWDDANAHARATA